MTTAAPSLPAWRNWAGNQCCQPANRVYPASVSELGATLREAARAGQRVRVVGAGHSFTALAATDGVQLHLDRLKHILAIDRQAATVTVEGGAGLRAVGNALAARGLALENLGDIDAQTVAGAISTGTHGTGARFGGLAAQVVSLDLVTAAGDVVHCSAAEEPDIFAAGRVGLGALGVISAVTLRCVPQFCLHAQETAESLDDMLLGLDVEMDAHDHVEFYWFPHTRRVLVKRNDRTRSSPAGRGRIGWLRDRVLLENVAFWTACEAGRRIPALTPRLAPLAVAGRPREFTDRSDRVFATPRWVRFVETEWALPRPRLGAALDALATAHEASRLPVSFPVEVRVAAADDIWLSTAYGRDTAYVAAHSYRGVDHRRWFDLVSSIMVPLGGRPHWGKLHPLDAADLAPAYPQWARWQAVRARLDPEGRFANPELDRIIGPAGAD